MHSVSDHSLREQSGLALQPSTELSPVASRREHMVGVFSRNDYNLPSKIHNSALKRRQGKLEVHYLVEWGDSPENEHYTRQPYEHLHESIIARQHLAQFH
jgi:hypothetical protein